MPRAIYRFLKYSTVGCSTFLLDLLLLYILTDYFLVNYIVAAGLCFAIAISVNYAVSRRYVFKNSAKTWKKGYFHFLLIALGGVLIVMSGMYVLVDLFGVRYLPARIIIAGITGFWSYLLNLFVNFKVAGKH